MLKKAICFLLCLAALLSLSSPAFAHSRDKHDEDLEYVLFGNTAYKRTHPSSASTIQALEDAVYLAIDQFNGSGQDALENLQKEKIPDLPKSIEEIDFSSNFAHRNFTHRGWNVQYDPKANWPKRQQILINTVRKELFSSIEPPLDWLPWLSNHIYTEQQKSIADKCESFSVLLYCVHIIGDHLEAEKYSALAYVNPLTRPNDRDNPGVVPDLIICCSRLFEAQKNTYTYKAFLQELTGIQQRSDSLIRTPGGINTDEKFSEYHKCAEDLLETLAAYIPRLLRSEVFFSNTFYN